MSFEATSNLGDWVVFDLETTGLSADWDSILQIAAVRLRAGRVLEEPPFFSYVNPLRPIPPWITQFTGIREDDVASAPTVVPVLQQFSRYVGDATLVAHNGHRFDMKFLAATCHRERLPVRPVWYHDSLALSWQLWGRFGFRHGLDAVIERLQLGSSNHRRHDARGDVELLARAVELMHERILERGPNPPLRRYQGALPQLP